MDSRVAMDATNAFGDSIAVPSDWARWKRRNDSCTTSSASATLPSMR